jgi:hypothetical protein
MRGDNRRWSFKEKLAAEATAPSSFDSALNEDRKVEDCSRYFMTTNAHVTAE